MIAVSKTDTSDRVETLVNTLSVDESNFHNEGTTLLTATSLEQFAKLSQEIHLPEEMENQDCDVEMDETQEGEQIEEELVQTEIGAQEIEIETERTQSPEEMLSDVKAKTSVPPLRPLTIAPKPEKVPIAIKPVSGQQLLLVQGTSGNQQIKLLSTHGQEINLALARSLTLKPNVKPLNVTSSNMSVVQPKQVMKKVITPVQKNVLTKANMAGKQGHIMVVQKSEPQIKVVQSASNVAIANTKTITLQQAQELGLLTGGKMLTQPSNTKHIVLNKASAKTVKIVPQTKSPTKILPAPQMTTTSKVPQRIILKPTNSSQAAMLTSGQIIQVTGGQTLPAGLHQINIPGKGVQFIKFVNATSADSNVTTSANLNSTKTVLQTSIQNVSSTMTLKPTNLVLSEVKSTAASNSIAPKPIKPSVNRSNVQVNNTSTGQLVVLPAGYITQQANTKVPIPVRLTPTKPTNTETLTLSETNLESNGIRPRKPCNCTKSQCLKLYCDCFANGEFCHMCNCMNCYNNIENEEHRQRAIKNCLERNPNAFRPKIGKAKDNTGDVAVRKHTKGCNCKRSGCLKNYCECYEAKIACSSNCKCMGCRNIEDSMDKKSLRPQATPESIIFNGPATSPKLTTSIKETTFRPRRSSNSKQAFSYITSDVIEATTQCLLALSDNAESDAQDEEITKKQIIEEFGRCLMEIIDCSINSTA